MFKSLSEGEFSFCNCCHLSFKDSGFSQVSFICVRQNASELRLFIVNCNIRWFYDVPRVFIADARSFQAYVAILDFVTHLASITCWCRSDARQDKFVLLCMSKVRG